MKIVCSGCGLLFGEESMPAHLKIHDDTEPPQSPAELAMADAYADDLHDAYQADRDSVVEIEQCDDCGETKIVAWWSEDGSAECIQCSARIREELVGELAELRRKVDKIRAMQASWVKLLAEESQIMTTSQRNTWRDCINELSAVLEES